MVDPDEVFTGAHQANALITLPGVKLTDLAEAARILLHAIPTDYKVVCFEGQMGAGKTTLIKELCGQLGVSELVTSPTYALVNEYEGDNGQRICHFDFYRIKHEQEAADIGVGEYFYSGDLCLVEWPSQIPSLLPERYARIMLEVTEPQARTITLYTN